MVNLKKRKRLKTLKFTTAVSSRAGRGVGLGGGI